MRTAVLGAVVASLITGGCVTAYAKKVGVVHEVPAGYREVQLSGTTLQVRYKTMRWVAETVDAESGRPPGYTPIPNATTAVADTPDRWISVSLESLPWLTLDRLGPYPPSYELPRDCSTTASAPDPAPAMTVHTSRSPFKDWYSPNAPDYAAPIAAYVEQEDNRRLVLVRASSGDGQRAGATLLAIRSCYHDRPWAPYARAVLVPFAVVADVVTAPFQVFVMLAIFAAIGLRGR